MIVANGKLRNRIRANICLRRACERSAVGEGCPARNSAGFTLFRGGGIG